MAEAQRLLATHPDHELAPMLRVFLAATVLPTKDEAVAVLVKHANMSGDWASDVDDEQRAMEALNVEAPDEVDDLLGWHGSIWAQYATLKHFMVGAEL